MSENYEVIHSPLEQEYSSDGRTVSILIYRLKDSLWTLELEDEYGNSNIWNDLFKTDQQAFDEALSAIKAEGIASFCTTPENLAQEAVIKNSLNTASVKKSSIPKMRPTTAPLSDEELEELDHFLLYEIENDDHMLLEHLDGYFHAIAIGPVTVMPSQWLARVWGADMAKMPIMNSIEELNHIMGLVMRHYNSIISGFEMDPPLVDPYWSFVEYNNQEFLDAELWAEGFSEGVKLNQAAWASLLQTPKGQQWFRPIGLLGEFDFCLDQDELTKTPMQREQLALEIKDNILNMHAHWLPYRKAIFEREVAQSLRKKTGRNDPCPCGSGKKFKKCCGFATELH
jgi:uncharacterized protein